MTEPRASGRVDSPTLLLSLIEAGRQIRATPMEVAHLCDDGALDCRYQFDRRVVLAESLAAYVASLPKQRDGAA